MKRFPASVIFLVLLFVGLNLMGFSCGGDKEVPPEQPPQEPVVTEPVDTTTPPPPPPPPPQLKESQFKTIHFEFDKYDLKPSAREGLEHNYELLKEFSDVIVKIEGHCDERGTVEYNLSLGEKRAKAAKDYLVNLGIDAARIQTISYGKERPLDPASNEAAWAKNRRCEFKIISQ